MKASTSCFARYFLLGVGAVAWGCGDTGNNEHPGTAGSSGSIGSAGSGNSPGSGGSSSYTGPEPVTTIICGAECNTDLAAARSALEAGNYAGAFELYHCANTPEAAFGAGLSRLFLILEGANATALLADFGETPISATDIFGADGVLSREAARWEGQGTLGVSGGATLDLAFDRAQQRIPEDPALDGYGRLDAEDSSSAHDADLAISFVYPPTAPELTDGAELGVSFDCGASYPTRTVDPRLGYVDLSFEREGVPQWCTLAYLSSTGACEGDGGSVIVNSAPKSLGQPASYTLRNLWLSCTPDDDSAAPPADYMIRVNGTISALGVSQQLDTTGLHPILSGDFALDHIPADRKGTDLLQHAGAAATELEQVACFFARAAQGSGAVFDVPGMLFGGRDSPVSKGDTQLLAGLALLGAAAAELTLAHDLDMPLNQLICDADVSPTPCLTDPEYVNAFNQAFASGFRPDHFVTAERLVGEALPFVEAGLANLDGASLLIKNEISAQGLGMMQDVVRAARQSLAGGLTALPQVSPVLSLDLGAFFADPRNPRSMSVPSLRHLEECELDVCTASTELDPVFLDEYFAGTIEADWEGSHEWTDEDAISDALEEASRNIGGRFVLGN